MEDLANWILTWLSQEIVAVFAALAVIHRIYIVIRYGDTDVKKYEHLMIAFALLNVAAFYFALSFDWLIGIYAVAMSRLVFIWLVGCLLYISHRMATRKKMMKKQQRKNGQK